MRINLIRIGFPNLRQNWQNIKKETKNNNKMNTNKFRFIKFQLKDNSWRTYFNPSEKRLKKLLVKHQPKNVYRSVNRWIMYQEHPSYPNRMIQHFGLVDVDGQNFDNKEECYSYFSEVCNLLESEEIQIEEKVCTNNSIGGFQALISPDSLQKFHVLLENHPQRFLKLDYRVHDDKRVCRLPRTWNGNRNSLSYSISQALNNSYIQIQKGIGRDNCLSPLFPSVHDMYLKPTEVDWGFSTLGMSYQADDKGQVRKNSDTRPNITTESAQIESNEPLHHTDTFLVKQISNSVIGVKNLYVPVIKLKYCPSPRLIRKLQKTYRMGDLYLFQYHSGFFLIGPKVFQKERLFKIYKAAKAWASLKELQTYKQNWITISNAIDESIYSKIETFKYLSFHENSANGWYSNSILYWLKRFNPKDYENMIGNKPTVHYARFKRK